MQDDFTIEVSDRLIPVSDLEWSHLFHHSSNTAAVAHTLETAGLEGFTFSSILVRKNNYPVLLLPLFFTTYDLLDHFGNNLKHIVNTIQQFCPNILRVKLLRVGIVDQQCGQIGYDPDISLDDLNHAWNLAIHSLESISAQKKVQVISFTEFTPETGCFLPLHKLTNYAVVTGPPFCQLKINFPDLESFLKGLSKDMRHYLRRAIKKSQGISIVRTREPEQWINDIYQLYLKQVERSKINLNGTHYREYFAQVCKLDPNAHYSLYFDKNHLIGFELLSQCGSYLVSKFISLDPEIGRAYKLYFRSWLDLIEYALQHNVSVIDLGCTEEGLKSQLGASHLVPSFIILKHRNPFINYFLHKFKNHFAYYSTVPVPYAELGIGWELHVKDNLTSTKQPKYLQEKQPALIAKS